MFIIIPLCPNRGNDDFSNPTPVMWWGERRGALLSWLLFESLGDIFAHPQRHVAELDMAGQCHPPLLCSAAKKATTAEPAVSAPDGGIFRKQKRMTETETQLRIPPKAALWGGAGRKFSKTWRRDAKGWPGTHQGMSSALRCG